MMRGNQWGLVLVVGLFAAITVGKWIQAHGWRVALLCVLAYLGAYVLIDPLRGFAERTANMRHAFAVMILWAWALLALYTVLPQPRSVQISEPVAAAQAVDARAAAGHDGPEARPRPRRIDPRYSRAPMPVALARLAWVESTTRVTPEETAALHEVISQRMRSSWRATAWAYSFGLRHPRRSYVQDLGSGPVRSTVPYVRERWPTVLAGAERVVSGDVTHGCGAEAPLVHFGGKAVDVADIARLVARGFVVADCPEHFRSAFLYDGNAARRARFDRNRGR